MYAFFIVYHVLVPVSINEYSGNIGVASCPIRGIESRNLVHNIYHQYYNNVTENITKSVRASMNESFAKVLRTSPRADA